MSSANAGSLEARKKKLFALADHLGLTRDERIELSRAILYRDITSWSGLSGNQVDRMLDALEGAEKVMWLLSQRDVMHPAG